STVNARLRQENRLRAQMEARLREAHQSKTRFMSATSHDLLQPINAARLFMQALTPRLAGGADEQSQHMLAQIDSSLNRAEQLISELREISRLDSGRQQVNRAAFFAGDFLRSLYDEFLPLAKKRGLNLRFVPSSLWVYSDEKLLRRILQNLVANALKYTRSGGVLLGLRRKGESVLIQVWDTGPGIDAADHARMFDEFERLTQGNAAEGAEGLGLGLSIVRRYAQLLGYRLDLSSRVGRGTVFSVQVPVAAPVPKTVNTKTQNEVRDLSGLSVISLDNDVLVREGMLQMLHTLKATVSLAADRYGLQDLLAGTEHCDVILADYHLDEGDTGVQAVRDVLAATGRDIPCIVISADDSEAVRADVQAAGYFFMSKPVRGNRLAARIRALKRASPDIPFTGNTSGLTQ
ncbi:MAG: histidine kinase, partial [Gammaproteobacteria bacterium]